MVLASLAGARRAYAENPPIDIRADDVTLDARTRELDISGNVRVDAPPFYLTSDRLRLWRSSKGVVVNGAGRLAFCPCLGTPLTIEFKGATVAPPGDLILRQPRLELYHVPILWLPAFWLRSPERAGVLPPDIAYRGGDGLFLGDGIHVPWRAGDPTNGLDLRAGGYLNGGFAAEARLRTDTTLTRLRVDDLRGEAGLMADARGALLGRDAPAVAWDVDALRGPRAVVATTELDAASRVFDRASGEVTWRSGSLTLASGVRAASVRGTSAADLGAAGPVVSGRLGEALAGIGAYDVQVEGGGVAGVGLASMSFARTAADMMVTRALGPVTWGMSARGVADVAATGDTEGYDAAGSVRAELALPVGRAYASGDTGDPWLHRVEPRLAAAAILSRGDDLLGYLPSLGGVRGAAWVAGAGLSTSFGRWAARDGAELSGDAGAVGNGTNVMPVVRWRAAATGGWVGVGADGAHVLSTMGTAAGTALAARARIGPVEGLHVAALVAGRDGVDPLLARALTDAPLAPSSGFLATQGWTGGARVGVPLGPYLMTQAGADADLTRSVLLAARGAIEFKDRCGCLAIRALASERIGRPGVDVWLTIDLAPNR